MKKKTLKNSFDFDTIPNILGLGVSVIEREISRLAVKSEKGGLNDFESKTLISFINALCDVKKDHLAELAAIQKELKTYSDEQLHALLQKESN